MAHICNSSTQEAEPEVQVQDQSGLHREIVSKERDQRGEEGRERGEEMKKDRKKQASRGEEAKEEETERGEGRQKGCLVCLLEIDVPANMLKIKEERFIAQGYAGTLSKRSGGLIKIEHQ